jgi:hypothetical protein
MFILLSIPLNLNRIIQGVEVVELILRSPEKAMGHPSKPVLAEKKATENSELDLVIPVLKEPHDNLSLNWDPSIFPLFPPPKSHQQQLVIPNPFASIPASKCQRSPLKWVAREFLVLKLTLLLKIAWLSALLLILLVN